MFVCVFIRRNVTRGENVSKVDAGQWHKMKSGFAFY